MFCSLKGYVVVLFALLLGLSVSVLSAPSSVVATTRMAPEVGECTVAPRAFEDISILAGTPAPPANHTADDETPAFDDVIASLTETVADAVACANANDVLRSLALFTDRYVAERFGADHPDDLGSLQASLSRTPTPAIEDDVLTVVGLSDVTSLDETWASATVITSNRDGQFTDRLVFELVGDRWLIDSWTPLEEPTGTPTA